VNAAASGPGFSARFIPLAPFRHTCISINMG
jgi:hypothetical protein